MKESEILNNIKLKLGISELNEMQKETLKNFNESKNDFILLAPTGSGKTIAFLIPLFKLIKQSTGKLQAVIIAPSRELVIQIESITRTIANDLKVSVCYGGHSVIDEKNSLAVTPDIIVSTPGRLLDHINRKNIDVFSTKFLILDEFDKSLELGFQDEMEKIVRKMPNLNRNILTSATALSQFPQFLRLNSPQTLNFLAGNKNLRERIKIHRVDSVDKDKLHTLLVLLSNLDNKRCIVFANHREAVNRIYEYLIDNNIPAGIYNGALDQIEREKAVEMFNNGSFKVLVCTDLGARGLDIEEVAHIVHYHLPLTPETYAHRNGRSARVDATGDIEVIIAPDEKVPEYMVFDDTLKLDDKRVSVLKADYTTLYFQAGKKEKLSKGDVVGFLINQADLSKEDIGNINSHDHYTLVAVPADKAMEILNKVSNLKIKNKKIRISIARQ